jgi:pimeloyl-ACP methyl ester carboxylesterase
MIPEIVFHEGERQKPLVVFIHGMGMNVRVWSEPSEARILGGKYPLRVLLGECTGKLETSFADLKARGYHLLSWSQTRPVGPVAAAVAELGGLMEAYRKFSGNGTIFVCHSRGGLIARKYLESQSASVRGLITLATPHHGTSMARWAAYVSPLTGVANRVLTGLGKKEVDSALRRILGFLGSSGLRELLPDSRFLRELSDTRLKWVGYVSAGGTNPDLLRAVSVSLPGILSAVVPEIIIPEEMREGRGDGLVSASSSVLPCGDSHRNFHVNHGSILCDAGVRRYVLESVRRSERGG